MHPRSPRPFSLRTRIGAAAVATTAVAGVLVLPAAPAAAAPPQYFWTEVPGTTPNANLVAMSDDGSTMWEMDGTSLRVSTDGGMTWAAPSGRPGLDEGGALAVSGDGSTVVAAGDDVYRSTDLGSTWERLSSPFPVGPVISLAVDEDGDTVVVGGGSSLSHPTVAVHRSSGWTPVPGTESGTAVFDVDVDDAGSLFAGTLSTTGPDHRAHLSAPGGTAWAPVAGSPSGSASRVALSGAGDRLDMLGVESSASFFGSRVILGRAWETPVPLGPYAWAFASADDIERVVTLDLMAGSATVRDAQWNPITVAAIGSAVVDHVSSAAISDDGGTILLGRDSRNSVVGRLVVAPTVATDPTDTTATAGATATFSTAGAGAPAPATQWQEELGGTWADIDGATASTLSLTATTGLDGRRYRAVLTNPGGHVESAPATLRVTGAPNTGGTTAGAPVPRTAGAAAIALRFAAGDRVADGLELVASATGLQSGSEYTVDLFSTPTRLHTGTASASGSVTQTVRIPNGTPAGAHRLLLSGTGADGVRAIAQAWFALDANGVVTAVSTSGPVADPTATRTTGALARTGADLPVAGLAGLAAALILGSALALVIARRRRSA